MTNRPGLYPVSITETGSSIKLVSVLQTLYGCTRNMGMPSPFRSLSLQLHFAVTVNSCEARSSSSRPPVQETGISSTTTVESMVMG